MQLEQLLEKLFTSNPLSKTESHHFFTQVIQGKVSNEQLAAALIALKLRGETVEEIAGAANAALENATPFPIPNYPFADIVGTGGDGHNTINISTTSAIIAATMGYKIAKHGNRSVSSKTGSSDVLTHLGINVGVTPETARLALDKTGICFLFAPTYHSGFKYAAPVRQILKTRTIFNILGPLINPAHAKYQLLGVYSPELVKIYAETVKSLGYEHTIVVHGAGLDEVAIHDETQVAEIKNGKIEYYTLTPEDFGIPRHSIEAIKGGIPAENAEKVTAILQGKGEEAQNDAVAVNVALLMKLFGEKDIKTNVLKVKKVLASGKAFETLQQLMSYQ